MLRPTTWILCMGLMQQNQVWPLTNVSDPWRVGCVYRVGRFDTEPLQSIRPCGPVGHHLTSSDLSERKKNLFNLSFIRPSLFIFLPLSCGVYFKF